VVSDLVRERPIWFGGTDRSEASMDEFYRFLGEKPAKRIRLAVMDMWRPFRNSTESNAPQAAILTSSNISARRSTRFVRPNTASQALESADAPVP
jgi:transposase